MHFDVFPDPATLQFWKTNFKTEVSDTVLWIKEVEMAESVDDLKTSQSMRGHRFPNFEMFDAKIASALKKIISNPYSKKRVSLEEQKAQKQNRFLQRRLIVHMIYEYFRVTCAHEAVLDYTDLLSIT